MLSLTRSVQGKTLVPFEEKWYKVATVFGHFLVVLVGTSYERLFIFISKWGRISPESDWCWLKLVLGSFSLLLRGYMDLSPAVGHICECPIAERAIL